MSTVKDIEAAIPNLSSAELDELRMWLDDYIQQQRKRANGQTVGQRRSILHLRSLPGRWIGEPVLKSGDLADEMFARG